MAVSLVVCVALLYFSLTAILFFLQYEGVFTYIPNQKHYTIYVNDDGFTPAQLTIHRYDLVTFVNDSESFHWPVSNPYPTHDLYPQFNSKDIILPHKSWTFRFDRVGTWRYDDYIIPYDTGAVTVLP